MKTSEQLPIPLSRPLVGVEEEEACLRVLRSGVLVQGPEGEALERSFAERVGARHAVAVSSGTAALQLALMACGVGPGDEVIVPAYTFIASANAVKLTGARVVLADVQQDSLNLDPEVVAAVASERTKAVMPVHQFGLPADLPSLERALPGIKLVEDAACAAGAQTANGQAVGSQPGSVACFSFHPRKVLTSGEGGMITTEDDLLAQRLRSLRQHGQGEDGTREAGYNFRMGELAAAVGRVQLSRLDQFLLRRKQAAGWYRERLARIPWLRLPLDKGPFGAHIYQSFVIRCTAEAPRSREDLILHLRAQGIGCQAGVHPIHQHKPYLEATREPLPVAEEAGQSVLFLPMFADLSESQVDRVCSSLIQAAQA